MKRLLLLGLFLIGTFMNAQITLGSGTTMDRYPIASNWGYNYTQQIISKTRINAVAGQGNITGLKFYLPATANLDKSNQWTVYVGHTSLSAFAGTAATDWIPASSMTQVFSGTIVNNAGTVEITFTAPFTYNNTDNLVIAVHENTPDFNTSSDFFYGSDSEVPNSSMYYRNDNVDINPVSPIAAGGRNQLLSNITLMGLTLNPVPSCPLVVNPSAAQTNVPVRPTFTWNAVNGVQGYRLSIGTSAGATNILNNFDLGNVTTYTLTAAQQLSPLTQYFYTIKAYNGANVSTGCTERNFTTSVPSPANDDCTGAIVLTVNADLNCAIKTAGNTMGASQSMIAGACSGTPDDDVWYSFVATAASHVIALSNVVATVGTSTDMYFQVLSGTCGTSTSLLCSDPDTGTVTGLTVGQTYYIRVYNYYGSGNNDSFNICVGTQPPPPANDSCGTATMVASLPYTFTQNDGSAATNNGGFISACSGTSGMNDGVWYTFTGDGSSTTVKVKNTTAWDPEIGVYTGSCGSFTCVGSIDDYGSTVNNVETLTFNTTAGTTYYANVGHYSSSADNQEGSFEISISSVASPALATSEVKADKNNIKAYPNPFTDILNISDVNNVKSISVVDVSGKLVKTFDKPESVLHLRELNSGMYLVILNMKDGSKQTIKAIKK